MQSHLTDVKIGTAWRECCLGGGKRKEKGAMALVAMSPHGLPKFGLDYWPSAETGSTLGLHDM